MEMERYRLEMLTVTETHLPGEGEILLDESRGYKMIFSGRTDGRKAEGVGLAFSPQASNTLRYYETVSPRILKVEVLTRIGPMAILASYAPTNQTSEEVKEQFYADLEGVMTKTNGLTMVLGDFNASIGDSVPGVVGPVVWERKQVTMGRSTLSLPVHTRCVSQTHYSHIRLFTKQPGTLLMPDPSLV